MPPRPDGHGHRWVRQNKLRCHWGIGGLGMLVNRGRIGIRFRTGVEPDATVMRAALEANSV